MIYLANTFSKHFKFSWTKEKYLPQKEIALRSLLLSYGMTFLIELKYNI